LQENTHIVLRHAVDAEYEEVLLVLLDYICKLFQRGVQFVSCEDTNVCNCLRFVILLIQRAVQELKIYAIIANVIPEYLDIRRHILIVLACCEFIHNAFS